MTRTTVHHLTNGETNFTFRIAGNAATLITLGANNWATVKREAMTTEAARAFYAQAKKFGCTVGFTRHQAMRKLTTDAQYAAWVAKNFDFYNNDNDAEAELAWQEEYNDQGYIEVVA